MESEINKKLEFLNKLLDKNPDLMQQFEEYTRDNGNISDHDTSEYMAEMTRELKEELESLNADDPDWENYLPHHSGYIEEWEAYMHMAEDIVTDALVNFEGGIEDSFSSGRIDLALLGFVAGYDACLQADMQDLSDSLENPVFYVKEEMREIQKRIIQKLKSSVFPNRQVYSFFDAFFNHFKKYHDTNDEYLRFFEPLLLELSGDKERAVNIIRLLEEKDISRHYIPRLSTELYKVTGNNEKWRFEAENLFEEDVIVAKELLAEYSKTSYTDFIRIAKKLWQANRFKEVLTSFMFGHIDKEESVEFYKEVLIWLTSTNKSISKYKLLREVLTGKEKEDFIQANKGNVVFYTKMLEQEQRYEEILEFINRNLNSWHLNEMLSTILEPYPQESFSILENKIMSKLETERGRDVYQTIVEWLRIMGKIKGHEARTQQLIKNLYNWKPALPALKDELKQAGMK